MHSRPTAEQIAEAPHVDSLSVGDVRLWRDTTFHIGDREPIATHVRHRTLFGLRLEYPFLLWSLSVHAALASTNRLMEFDPKPRKQNMPSGAY
jgi:hypothetical protein